jgi:hypothetical protein
MKANDYKVLQKCVEDGVAYGYKRAFKYNNTPPGASIQNAIYEAVMVEIAEWFDFEDVAE